MSSFAGRRTIAVLLLALPIAGCSSDLEPRVAPSPTGPPVIVPGTPGGPNKTVSELPRTEQTVDPDDTTFLSDMMIHHTQALQMVAWAPTSAANPRVKALAERIRVGQKPEIESMRQLLTTAGQTPPNLEHVQHEDHSKMPGMATHDELTTLEHARGKAFDQLFLNLMIKHHEGAVAMSGRQFENGTEIRVSEMAQEISATQSKEISATQSKEISIMKQLLKEL